MKTLKKLLTAASLVLFVATPVFAADDGDLGDTSVGTSTITVEIGHYAQIGKVADHIMGAPYGGSGGYIDYDDVCVYTNSTDGLYKVTFGNPEGNLGTFQVSNGPNDIPFTVNWYDAINHAGTTYTGTDTERGDTVSAIANAATVYPSEDSADFGTDCTADASYGVFFTHVALMSSPAGTYTGTLTLTVEPNL